MLGIANRGRFSKVQYVIYLIATCDFVKPVLVEKYVDVGRRPQTIAWYPFAVKPIVNWKIQLD